MANPYGATVEAVKALLPNRRWTPGTKPDSDDLAGFMVSVAGVLDLDVDAIADDGRRERLTALARRAVVYGAAAQAEAEGGAERARPNEPTSYAAWLQARYQEAVEAAEGFYLSLVEGDVPGVGDVDADPAWSFPDPVGWAARGI